MRPRTEADATDPGELRVITDVQTYGWHVVLIPADNATPGWVFSIGLFQTLGHPEIVIFGLNPSVAHAVINDIGAQVRAGSFFSEQSEAAGLLEGVSCMFRPVAQRWYRPFLGTAIWYYQGTAFPVLQCIWPDHEQRYPWESGFREDWYWLQPLLFAETTAAARAGALLKSMGVEYDEGV